MNIWEGSKVRLRAIEPEDWEQHFEGDRDSEIARMLYYIPFPQSRADVKKWTEELALKKPENDEFSFAVETLAGEHVGMINSHHCEQRTGTFRYGIAIRPEYQRQGYASEAIRLLLRYFFKERRYQKCTIEIYEYNPASIKLHESFGFQFEGRLRRMLYTRGQFYDILFYGMTAEEFTAQHAD